MRKAHTDAIAPIMQSSKKSDKGQSLLSKKRFDIYNKTSKAKAEGKNQTKPEKVFEYYDNEYDEYLSS